MTHMEGFEPTWSVMIGPWREAKSRRTPWKSEKLFFLSQMMFPITGKLGGPGGSLWGGEKNMSLMKMREMVVRKMIVMISIVACFQSEPKRR